MKQLQARMQIFPGCLQQKLSQQTFALFQSGSTHHEREQPLLQIFCVQFTFEFVWVAHDQRQFIQLIQLLNVFQRIEGLRIILAFINQCVQGAQVLKDLAYVCAAIDYGKFGKT